MRWNVAISGLAMLVSAAPAAAQVLQLPSFHSFSVDTTVVVPDSGPRPLGGVRQGRAASSRFGGLPGRSAGVERDAANAAALAQIHDPRQAELALSQEARARQSNALLQAAAGPQRSQVRLQQDFDRVPLKSLAQIERERAGRQAEFDRETRQLVERARSAGAAGKPKVAAVYYSSAARRATGSLKQQIEREWHELDGGTGRQGDVKTPGRPR